MKERASAAATAAPTRTPTPTPGSDYIQSFARGLSVIRAFDAKAPSQTLTEVATRTGLTRAGARRILLTLLQLGYVRLDDKKFALTPRILDLGFAYLSSQPFWHVAEPEIEALVAHVKESSSVAVLDGAEIIYVMRVPTHKIMSINLGVGSRLPAHCTSMGRVLLGAMSDDELARHLKAHRPRAMTGRTVTDIDALVTAIRSVRINGWSLVNQELEDGLVSMAAPIVDRSGRTVAAINISGAYQRTPPKLMRETMLQPLLKAAHAISALLRMSA